MIIFGLVFYGSAGGALGCVVASFIRFKMAGTWFDPLGNSLAFGWADGFLIACGVGLVGLILSQE